MRAIALAVFATGCQVLFPLREPDKEVDAPLSDGPAPDANDPDKPTASVDVPQPFAGEPSAVSVTVVGNPGEVATYEVAFSEGDPLTSSAAVTLSPGGTALDTITWTPGDELSRVSVVTRADYDPALAAPNVSLAQVDVYQRFGNRSGNAGPTSVSARIVAIPIDIPKLGALKGLGVQVSSTASGMLGIYRGTTKPEVLVAKTEAFPLEQTLTVIEHEISSELQPGRYWLAFVADGNFSIGGDSGVDGNALTFDPLPTLDLPDTPEDGIASAVPYALSATVGPP